jgi:hypothetical protein
MSLEGTPPGVAGALGLGPAAVALGLRPSPGCWPIVIGATAGLAARELAGRDARGARHPQQRHAELHQHRRRRARGARRSVAGCDVMKKPALLLEFSRPFTLVAPALGFVVGRRHRATAPRRASLAPRTSSSSRSSAR